MLAVGRFMLTVELFYLQLCLGAFLLTIGAFFAILALLLTIELFA